MSLLTIHFFCANMCRQRPSLLLCRGSPSNIFLVYEIYAGCNSYLCSRDIPCECMIDALFCTHYVSRSASVLDAFYF